MVVDFKHYKGPAWDENHKTVSIQDVWLKGLKEEYNILTFVLYPKACPHSLHRNPVPVSLLYAKIHTSQIVVCGDAASMSGS